jgi:hypothetical protein
MSTRKQFSLTEQSGLFLTKFQGRSANMYNSANVLEGRIKKKYNFVGKQMNIETQLSFSGSVGAKLLPIGNSSKVEQAVITAKKVYGRTYVDRESLKAASSTEGAFQKYLAFPVKKTVESYMRNMSRILFSDGSSILGRGDGATNVTGNGSVATPYLVTLRASDFNESKLEEKDFVQVVTGLNAGDNLAGTAEGGDAVTNLLEVVAVNPSTRVISLVGFSAHLANLVGGPSPLATTTGLAMQRSYLAEPQGLGGVLTATSGSLYGLPVQRRWQSTQVDALGAGIITDAMNEVMLKTEKAFGQAPKMIVMNYNQLQKILAQLEDQKVYNLPNRNLKGALSFSGVEFMSTRGPIPMFVDRFADEDKMYFLNDDFIERIHRPDFGWFDDDGTTFLRIADSDEYEARYGGYLENHIVPTAHGIITNLAK